MRNGRQDGNSDLQPIFVSLQPSPPSPEHFISVGTVWILWNGFMSHKYATQGSHWTRLASGEWKSPMWCCGGRWLAGGPSGCLPKIRTPFHPIASLERFI